MEDLDEMYEKLSFSRLINRLHAHTRQEFAMDKMVKAKADVKPWQDKLRKKFTELLCIDDLIAKRDPVTVEEGDIQDVKVPEGVSLEYIYINSWLGTLIPAYVLKPKQSTSDKLPAFVCLHGHGENKDSNAGIWNKGVGSTTAAIDLARRGHITIATDQWGFGERGFGPDYDGSEGRYNLNLLLYGRTINGLRVYDAMRCVDYLLTRDDVDASRIGCIGLSLGGTITTSTSAVDERIKMAVIEGYANTYKDSIVDLSHCTCNYTPGIIKYAEMPDILGLIAPRPMFWVTGEQDTIYTLKGFNIAKEKIEKLYKLLGASDQFATFVHPEGHRYLGGPELDFIQSIWG
ncbi:MAG TPA: alpha/beta fold hydrolase [Candidatus Lokiarchaeia archaeon]|nr:alpha/beta fold hydrolase [Candidatus Lokiarchaeia archaeon]